MSIDYAAEYDGYWASGDRFGEQSFADADALAEEILLSCGGGRVLDIGSGMGLLVRALVRQGVDAQGADISQVAVNQAQLGVRGRFLRASVLDLPYDDSTFDVVVSTDCLELLAEEDVGQALREIRRVARRTVYLRIATTVDSDDRWRRTVRPRSWWEQRFFEAGFRKHPSYYRVNDYEALENDGPQITVLLETIPVPAVLTYPLAALAAERDLHMDMLRETGARSDAHVARYRWATQFVRPGDVVLDAACGLGYGSYVLQSSSTAKKTLGIDGSQYAIDYAVANFSLATPGLEFRCGMLPEAFAEIADHSVDLVISFETLEHVDENARLLAEFHRVLTPGGRVITSVPNDWSDETGEDPNPFHLHVYTLRRLCQELGAYFIVEAVAAQTASQYKVGHERKRWQSAGRSLKPVALDVAKNGTEPNAEWWLAVAMRSPLDGATAPYREANYPTFPTSAWNVTTFSRDYHNAWLVRSMVDTGHRLRDPKALVILADQVAESSPPDSPDVGAALCVTAYQLLSRRNASVDEVQSLEQRVQVYFAAGPKTPHGVRWSISLLFVLGKLWLDHGDFSRAKEAFEECVSIDPLAFSPLLANRTVEACLILGLLCIGAKDQAGATLHWRRGIHEARRAIDGNWDAALGDIENPAEFGLPELASVLEYASSCAYALNNAHEIEDKPWWWIHPRRDRLSQTRIITAELRKTRLGLQQTQRELAAYVTQADRYARQVLAFETELTAYVTQAGEYSGQVQALQKECAAQATRADENARQLLALETELTAYITQADEYSKQVQALQKECAAHATRADENARHVLVLQHQHANDQVDCDVLRQRIEQAEQDLLVMRSSLCWHVTKPIRLVAKIIRRSFL